MWLSVEPVAIVLVIGRLQQPRFILKMKRADADVGHCCDLFDCICHRFLSAEITLISQAFPIVKDNVT